MTLAELNERELLTLGRRPKILLIDDDPAVLVALRRALRREPYELLSTVHPERALDWIKKGDVSLVVVDQRMPGMCGTEFARRVRRLSPETIRVMLTAYAGHPLVQRGLARALQWLIAKPWDDDALRLTLRQLLRDRATPGTGPPGPGGRSWIPGRAVRRITRLAAGGIGWILGFAGTTDAGGVLTR